MQNDRPFVATVVCTHIDPVSTKRNKFDGRPIAGHIVSRLLKFGLEGSGILAVKRDFRCKVTKTNRDSQSKFAKR
jgi:hypothetical protein